MGTDAESAHRELIEIARRLPPDALAILLREARLMGERAASREKDS